jgi:hypothetical protein
LSGRRRRASGAAGAVEKFTPASGTHSSYCTRVGLPPQDRILKPENQQFSVDVPRNFVALCRISLALCLAGCRKTGWPVFRQSPVRCCCGPGSVLVWSGCPVDLCAEQAGAEQVISGAIQRPDGDDDVRVAVCGGIEQTCSPRCHAWPEPGVRSASADAAGALRRKVPLSISFLIRNARTRAIDLAGGTGVVFPGAVDGDLAQQRCHVVYRLVPSVISAAHTTLAGSATYMAQRGSPSSWRRCSSNGVRSL